MKKLILKQETIHGNEISLNGFKFKFVDQELFILCPTLDIAEKVYAKIKSEFDLNEELYMFKDNEHVFVCLNNRCCLEIIMSDETLIIFEHDKIKYHLEEVCL